MAGMCGGVPVPLWIAQINWQKDKKSKEDDHCRGVNHSRTQSASHPPTQSASQPATHPVSQPPTNPASQPASH
ncbi:hypothetical protein E2C01_001433 [Portunus trituberculatus]|uniref:Uncharacterized protein n=1 Tax=Portunus trituberculatus TaxID=210409 RepID=A0A5B7CHA0_PORTR|nr:hypothetical protein [Portunus trituberculatus]